MTDDLATGPPPAEQRQEKRSRVFLTVLLHGPTGSIELKVTDWSPHGACGSCAYPPPPGAAIELVRGDVAVPARVAWSANGKIGIEFAEAVDEGLFRAQRQHGYAAPVTFRPVEKLSARLERHWTEILSR
jgi:hypothetical protein